MNSKKKTVILGLCVCLLCAAALSLGITAKNAEAAKAKLKQLGIRLVAEDTGLNYGRTVELHCDTGEFYIKSVGKPLKII